MVIWEEPGKLAVTEAADPAPGHGELIIQVGRCGICGTDVHIADGEFPPTPYPIIPGHEFAGRVVAVGDGVPAGWREGERVAVDPSLFCGYCPACRGGRGNLCANWNAIGDTVNGAFAEYVAVPAANAYRIPDSVDDAQGALIEPLSCAVHGLRRIGPVTGVRRAAHRGGHDGPAAAATAAQRGRGARSAWWTGRRPGWRRPRRSARTVWRRTWPHWTAALSAWWWTPPGHPPRSRPGSPRWTAAAGC